MNSPQYKIEKFVHGGFGLSHDRDGRAFLIRGTIAGETVSAKIHQDKKNVAKGVTTHVIEASPERIEPPCPSYKHCGGCDFQHMAYSCQLQAKEEILRDLLLRNGHPLLRQSANTLLLPPLASPQQFQYRQRIRLQVDSNGILGFYKHRSHSCVPIRSCLLANPRINQCLEEIRDNKRLYTLLPHTTSLEILFDPNTSTLTLLFHFKRKPRPADIKNGTSLALSNNLIKSVYFSGEDFALTQAHSGENKKSEPPLSLILPPIEPYTNKPLTLSWEVGGFCQVNIKQNLILIKTVLDFCAPEKTDTVLDLFCGMGNFSIPLAEMVQSVVGIEGQGSSIRCARRNSTSAAQTNTEFIKSPIHTACKNLIATNRQFDIVVIDPPRQGIPDLAADLSDLCKSKLIYISCDPATLCRDLAQLLEENFIIRKIQAVDMFPQTHHIESICLLEKT